MEIHLGDVTNLLGKIFATVDTSIIQRRDKAQGSRGKITSRGYFAGGVQVAVGAQANGAQVNKI